MVCVWFDPFWTKKYTFTDTYYQQDIVADSFLKTCFLVHVSHKHSKLIFFSAYLVYYTKGDKWLKFGFEMVGL